MVEKGGNKLSYDNACKYLAERSPLAFARWLLNVESENIKVLKTELSIEPVRADSLVLLQTSNQILQIEFQTLPYSNPPIPNRMLEYKARLIREYSEYSIEQFVIYLKFINSELVYKNQYQDNNTIHRYRVIRLWEEDPTPLLANLDLLPLATLAQSDNTNTLLEQVAERVAMIEEIEQRNQIAACTFILAGLRFDQKLINQILREDIMQESVTYQYILQKGIQQGLQQGELAMLRRLLISRFGALSPQIEEQLQRLSISQLEELGVAIFELSTVADLATWLESRQN